VWLVGTYVHSPPTAIACYNGFVSRGFATTELWLRLSAGPNSNPVAVTQSMAAVRERDLAEKCSFCREAM
jgi:hypothetical protein